MTLDRDKLAKILGLLGSDKTGEVMSAAQAADALIRNANTSWAVVLSQNVVADEAPELLAENNTLRETARQLSFEFESLRETAHRLLVENNALRKKAARRLSAGILLTVGIVAFLCVHGVTMLGEPSIRSGTMASSGQEAPEAGTRSGGLAAEAEHRGSTSDQPSSATKVTPEAIAKPTSLDDALARVEDTTTLPAILPPASGQTTWASESPSPVTTPAPAEEQAAPPATSLTTLPPAAQSSPTQHLSAAEVAALVTRGDAFLSTGDIVSARLFYERAADGGDGGAALKLGATFDPGFLGRTNIHGASSDPPQASAWYRRALDLGNSDAQGALKDLEQPLFAAPGSPRH